MKTKEVIECVKNSIINSAFIEFNLQPEISILSDSDGNVIKVSRYENNLNLSKNIDAITHHDERYMINMMLDNFYAARNHLSISIGLRIEKIKNKHGK